MEVRLGRELIESLTAFANLLERWTKEGKRRLLRAHRLIGQRWRSEAVKRVPVDQSRLKQGVLDNVFEDSDGTLVTEVGTNVEYGVYLEFGTEHIAGGAVKALGDDVFITDAQAVKSWPAKDADAISGNTEMMPWLRTSFNFIRAWVIEQLNEAYRLPGAKG